MMSWWNSLSQRERLLVGVGGALLVLMGETDAQYKAGIKSGSLHLMPTFNALFEAATTGYNAAFHAGLDTKAVYSPYTLKSDVNQLASLPIQQKGKVNTIIPSNEVINWQAGGVLTVLALVAFVVTAITLVVRR